MEILQRYVLSVTAAAVLCAVVKTLTEGKKGQEKVLSLVCGIFLLATALEPLDMLQMPSFANGTGQIEAQAQQVVDKAQAEASAQMAAIITQQTQSYILDKADTLGVCLEVGVELNEEMVPWRVTMTGEASPYARQRLEGIIQDDLGIPAERQVWSP